jgi:cobalt-zinc-cadmium efflux system outer membrane protein
MRFTGTTIAVWVAACLHAGVSGAQSRPLTLADVLARARELAPQIVDARLALEETHGRLVGAAQRFQTNPELDLGIGNRSGSGNRFTDFELGVTQTIEPSARRLARVSSGEAAIAEGVAHVEEITRTVLRSAAAAYHRSLHATQRVQLLRGTEDLAATTLSVAQQRFKAGDVPVLDVSLARVALARARSEREAAEAARTLALGDIKQILSLEEDVTTEGVLLRPSEVDLNNVTVAALQRPELRALAASVKEAEAEVQLASTYTKPTYGFGVRYAREEGDQIVLGGMTVTLPTFAQGQEQRAVSTARAARLRAELDAARTRVRIEVQSNFEAYNRRLAAIRVLEVEAIPDIDASDALVTRSYEVGQLGLSEMLLIRREFVDTRADHLDALLEAALARVDLDASAAILR